MIINGQSQTGTIIDAEKQDRIFTIYTGISFTLQNITLTNGWTLEGGAIYNSQGTLTINNSTLTENNADYGGAIYNFGTLTINQSTLTENTAVYDGGAIYNDHSTLTIDQSTLTQNTANCGGAIYNDQSTLTINQSTLTQNTPNYGGAIYNDYGTSEIHFSRIIGNTGIDVFRNGGTVNATCNWWGSNFLGTDPISEGRATSGVIVDPWVILTVNATPDTINNGETSTITADLNHINGGGDLVGGYIPDGTPVTFSLTNGPLGTLTPPLTVNTLSGIASIIFTASNVGVQVVNGTLDYQNVTASITILAAHVDLDTFYADYDEFINNNHNIVPITGPVNYLDHVIVVFTATNMGPNPVTDLVLREDWPSELTGTGDVWHTFDGANWILDSYLAQGSFNLYPTYDGPLDVGDVCLVVFGATVNASNTIITNTVSTTEQDPIDDEGFDTASADLEVNPEVNVTITKTADHIRPNVGETVVFTIVANNNGPGTANNLVVTDTLPTGLDFVSCTDGGVWDPVTRTVTWPSSVVFNGANVTYYLTALLNSTILAGTNVTNVVNETHTEYPYNSTTNCTIYVPQADLYIQITSDKNNPRVGETFTLTYKLGNNGPDDATNVTITIPIPEGFHISSITGDGTWNIVENNIIWTFNNVKVGDPYLYITGWTTAAGNYIFTASISSNTFNLNSRGVNSLSINAQPQVNAATTNTIGMQKTGIPLVGIVLAIMMLIGGFIGTCKKQ